MKNRVRIAVAWLARLVLAGTFAIAGVLKLADLSQAQLAVSGYRLVPEILLWPATLLLPWLEIFGGLGLLCTGTLRGARGLTGVLLLVFLAAIVSAWLRGIDLECGCFGGTGKSDYAWLIIRDLLLLGLLWLSKTPKTT